MNVSVLQETEAFTDGSEIWIIENDARLAWWQKIDFATCYLLTENLDTQKQLRPEPLLKIIEATNLHVPEQQLKISNTLLGTADHFQNKWLFVWSEQTPQIVCEEILKLSQKLKFTSLRLFSSSEKLLEQFKTRPMASSLTITYIENS